MRSRGQQKIKYKGGYMNTKGYFERIRRFCIAAVVRRCGNRIRFIWLYRYMRKHSADARSPHYGFATGRIKGYLWRLFQEPVCFVGINDNGYQSEWPAYYTRKEIKFWIKNN